MGVTLFGFRYSVYTRVVRLALSEKNVAFSYQEINPFEDPQERNPHPMGLVPTLRHNGQILHETRAITCYVDAAFDGPSLSPSGPLEIARMEQAISIIDNYGYWPLVRQVFVQLASHRAQGLPVDKAEAEIGLEKSRFALSMLENLELKTPQNGVTRADIHLAPMIAYFVLAPEGRAMLRDFPRLSHWWDAMQKRPSFSISDPEIETALAGGSAP